MAIKVGARGAPRQAALAFVFITVMMDMIAIGVTAPILPRLIERFSGDIQQAGWINGLFMTVFALMQFLCSPVQGALSDRFGRRPIILSSIIGLGGTYALMAVAPNLWWLGLARVLAGASSANISTAFAYIADVTPPERRAGAYGLVGGAFGLGFILGPALGGVLGAINPSVPFWTAAGLSLMNALYGWLVLPESLAMERRSPFAWRRANPMGSIGMLGQRADLAALASINFLTQFGFSVLPTVLVLYAGDRYGWGVGAVGLSLTLIGLCSAGVQAGLTGRAVKWWGERKTMVVSLLFGVAGMAVYGWAPTGLIYLIGIPLSTASGMAGPSAQAMMTRMVSASEQGQLQGANASLQSMAGILAPLLFGGAYSLFAGPLKGLGLPGAPFFVAAVVLLGAAVLAFVAPFQDSERVGEAMQAGGFIPPAH